MTNEETFFYYIGAVATMVIVSAIAGIVLSIYFRITQDGESK